MSSGLMPVPVSLTETQTASRDTSRGGLVGPLRRNGKRRPGGDGGDADGAPVRSELRGVGEQVEQDLADTGVVRHDWDRRRAGLDPHLLFLLRAERGGIGNDALNRFVQVGGGQVQRHPAGFDLRQVEHRVDEAEQVLSVAENGIEELALQFVDADRSPRSASGPRIH